MTDSRWWDKLSDDELLRFAADRLGHRSVLIEVAAPRPRAEIGAVARAGPGRRLPVGLTGGAQAPDVEAIVTDARLFLTGVLGVEPVWLGAAQSFVADVTADQLQPIARSPLVRAIHPNRELG